MRLYQESRLRGSCHCPQETRSQTSGTPVFQPLTSRWPPKPPFQASIFFLSSPPSALHLPSYLVKSEPSQVGASRAFPRGAPIELKDSPISAPQGLLLLLGSGRLPPSGSRVTTQGSVPFSKKPDKFRDELTRLGLTFPLTWQDIMVTLAPRCTCDEKEQRLRNARRPSDGLLAASQHHQTYQAGGDEPRA